MSKSVESSAAARWRELVLGQARSGLSVAAYCRRVQVPQSSFYAWRRRLRDAGFDGSDAATFAEVRVTPEPAEDTDALEVRLTSGRRIVVRPGFDQATLLALLDALEKDVTGGVNSVADREAGV